MPRRVGVARVDIGRVDMAPERSWNSPTTLYLARRIESIAAGRRLAVLDLGCGAGTALAHLWEDSHDFYGCDISGVEEARTRLRDRFGTAAAAHVRLAPDERTIPFEGQSFDIVYASQVFEHVRFFDRMVGECARVLRPGGVFLANFPLATYPVEWHLKIPFAHWLPPGRARVQYLRLFYALGLRPRLDGSSALHTALSQNAFLRDRTFYRFVNEVMGVGSYYFDRCEIETRLFIRAKRDLLATSSSPVRRAAAAVLRRADGPLLESLVTYLFNAAFCMTGPKRHAVAASDR